jgi:putative ABC transport system permease protein
MMQNDRWRRWLRLPRDPEQDVDDEIAFHFEERVRDYIARGMDPDTARRAALGRMGDIERARVEGAALLSAERRTEERRMMLKVSWLDVKLGLRMLGKYPGLSLVAVLGMAVAIAIGVGYFAAFSAMFEPALPLDEGDRVVAVRFRDVERAGPNAAVSPYDYDAWRAALRSVRDLGAFRSERRNLITDEGRIELVDVASMTASGFRVARVSAALGRPLLDEDERPGAAPVLVIAHEEWRRVFDGDPRILGRTVRLGATAHTVVGVMPEGFRFPVNHRYWVPLVVDAAAAQPTDAASLLVFGRLEDGVTLRRANAELATIGERMAAASPETHERLRPVALAYTQSFLGIDSPETGLAIRALQLAVSLLLVIVALNVAVLVYARTVTRTGEIAVRSALGASRRRVVAQLFVEALVLSVAASVIGVVLAGVALHLVNSWWSRAGERPFWLDIGLSPGAVVYVALLAVLAAAIVGALPALKATGKRLQGGLQQFSSRGGAMQLGRTWLALIIVQVAVAVAALPAAVDFAGQSIRLKLREPAGAAHRMLRATVVMEREASAAAPDSAAAELAYRARFAERTAELIRRVEAQPEVAGATFADQFPGHESWSRFEVEQNATPTTDTLSAGPPFLGARVNLVGIDLFDLFDVPILAGRGFVPADVGEGSTAAVVSASFAEQIAGGASVLGRRIRYVQPEGVEPGPWLEIVGVVRDFAYDFTAPNSFDPESARLFHPIDAGDARAATLVVRTAGTDPAPFAVRIRDIAATVDPALTLENVETVVAAWEHTQQAMGSIGVMVIAVALSVLLLSAAGIYAMMSFTVAKRRREIGIRSALGADPRRILTSIFARASAQLGAGVLAGLVLAAAFTWATGDADDRGFLLLPAVAVVMLIVGLLAALGPARRGLAVQPTEALREE